MSADLAPDLDAELVDVLAPDGAPSDDDIAAWTEVADVDPDAPEPRMPWRIDDLGAADWAARRARQCQQRIDAAKAHRDRVVAAADAHVDRVVADQQPTIDFFTDRLADWLVREIDADLASKPKQSRDLPCGARVRRTAGRPRLVVEDEAALVDWLTSQEDTSGLVEPRWVVDKAAVKQLVTRDGLALKGAHVETGPDSVKVDLGGGS